MPTGPDLTVVINTRDRNRLLERTLHSLSQCDQPPGFRGVLVLENGGTYGAEAVVRAAPPHLCATYALCPKSGVSATRNYAVERVQHGLIVWLDDDVRLSPSVLTAYASAAAVVEEPGQGANPLVLHGPVGTGKTHLLEGIW